MISEQEFTAHVNAFAKVVRAPTKQLKKKTNALSELSNRLQESTNEFMTNPRLYNCVIRSQRFQNYAQDVIRIVSEMKGACSIVASAENTVLREEILSLLDDISPEIEDRLRTITEEYEAYEAEQNRLALEKCEEYRIENEKRDQARIERLRDSIEDLSPETVQALYVLYLEDPKLVVSRLMHNYFPCYTTYAPYPNVNMSFLDKLGVSEIVKASIKLAMKCVFDLRMELVDEIKALNPTIADIAQITYYILFPPFPLMNCWHEDEYNDDHLQLAAFAGKANTQHLVSMNERLCSRVLDGSSPGEIKVAFETPDSILYYHLHSYVLEEYPTLMETKHVTLKSDEAVPVFIRGLYTGNISLDLPVEIAKDIEKAAHELGIVGLEFMANELVKDTVSPPGFAVYEYEGDESKEDDGDESKEDEGDEDNDEDEDEDN
jgi:hypothetical protein